MSTSDKQSGRADYRKAIRLGWLPLVGRKKFTSYESALVNEWYSQPVPVSWILRAIQAAKESGKPLQSLGFIRPHLARIARERGKLSAGAHTESEDWRAQWAESLLDLAEETTDPELRAMYNELREALPSLTKEEAHQRWQDINAKG